MTASSNRDLDILKDATAIGLGGGYLKVVPSVLASTYSAYGSLDFDILPKLTFDVGGRVSLDTRQLTLSQAATPDYTLISVPSIVGFTGNHSETYFLPTAGFNYKPTDNLMLYAKYSAGQKPGGYNADFVQDIDPGKVPYQYSAEKVKSYEIGAKSDLLDRRLTANIAGFLNNFKNFQLYQFGKTPSGAIYTALVNAGEVRTYGVETEFKARPITGLDLGLSFSRLFATYTSFPNGGGIGINYDGHQLEYAPKWTGAANADYTHDLNLLSGGYWVLGTNFYMRSASYADASNSASYHLSASKLLGARVGIGAKGPGTFEWEVSFSGENLLNSDALTNISDDGLGILVGFREVPRRYLGKVSIKF
jgi:iron complex outermembrane receptor protein